MNSTFDAAIIGLGAMGAATAWRMALAGCNVVGFDRFGPPHDLGSSHGESRVIRQAYFESPEYVPMALRAYELWRQLETLSSQKLLHITGGLMIGEPQSQIFTGSLESARKWNLPHEVLDADQIRSRWPVFQPDHHCALFEERAGVLPVEACVETMLAQAKVQGATLHHHQPVKGWTREKGGFAIHTDQGTWKAKKLILCPGPWAPEQLGYPAPLTVERLVLHWFRPQGSITPFLPKNFPVYIWEQPECAFYGMGALNGGVNGVKTAFHDVKTLCSPADIDREVAASEKAHMAQYIDKCIPTMNGAHLAAKTCMYTSTPDEHFILGPHPRHPDAFVACGFSGHGFKFAPAVGEILTQMALEGRSELAVDIFNPQRFEAPS